MKKVCYLEARFNNMYISVMMGPSRGGAAAAGGEAPEQPEPGRFL